MKRTITTAIIATMLLGWVALLAIAAAPTTLPAPVAAALQADIARDLKAAGITADAQVTVAGYMPITWATTQPMIASTQPSFINVTLASPLDLSDKKNAAATAPDPSHPIKLTGIAGGASVVVSNDATARCTLANVILDSPDGKGIGWNIHGKDLTIKNVNLGNLGDALRMVNTPGLTLINPKQTGLVTGRCVFVTNWNGGSWTGGTLGFSSQQSPFRCSSDVNAPNGGGLQNVTVDSVTITQVGSPFPIACAAIHRAIGCKFVNMTVSGGEFSFDSAGEGNLDEVAHCVISNLTVKNSKLNLGAVAHDDQVIGGDFTNPTGECVSLSCGSGVEMDGLKLHSPKHGIHFYAKSNAVIKNCTLFAPKGTPIIDGACTPQNDGGGNKLVVTP